MGRRSHGKEIPTLKQQQTQHLDVELLLFFPPLIFSLPLLISLELNSRRHEQSKAGRPFFRVVFFTTYYFTNDLKSPCKGEGKGCDPMVLHHHTMRVWGKNLGSHREGVRERERDGIRKVGFGRNRGGFARYAAGMTPTQLNGKSRNLVPRTSRYQVFHPSIHPINCIST